MGQDLAARVVQQRDDGQRGEEFDQGRRQGLLQNVAEIVLAQLPGGCAEPADFVVFRAEGFHHVMAAEGFLQNLVELARAILHVARGAADAPSQSRGRNQDEGQHGEAYQTELPVVVEQHEEQSDDDECLTQKVGQDVRGRDLNLFDVVHDGRHQLAGRMRFEELGALAHDFLEHAVTQVRHRGNADVVHQIVAEVVADSLHQEDRRDPDRDHRKYVMDAETARNQIGQVDGMIGDWNCEQRLDFGGRGGVQHQIENRTDQERHHGVGGADTGHQDDRCGQHRPIRPREVDQPEAVLHAGTRNLDSAAVTCSTEIDAMPFAPTSV